MLLKKLISATYLTIVIVFTSMTSFSQIINNTISFDSVNKSVDIALKKVKPQNLNVSLVKLITTPEKYQGQIIQVVGYLKIEFERNAVYFHKEDYDHKIDKDGFWVLFSDELKKQIEPDVLNGKYVTIIGEFDSTNLGNKDKFSGCIKNIIRLTPVSY